MKSKYLMFSLIVVLAVSLLGSSSLFAQQEKTKYEDYLAQLQVWKDREAAAQARIQQLQTEIDGLREQLNDLDRQISDVDSQIWSALGTTPQGFESYLSDLEGLRSQIQGLLNLNPGDLYRRADEVDDLASRIDELSSRTASKHPDAQALIDEINTLMNRLRSAVENAQPSFDTYTVVRGDHLWGISKNDDVYGDPFQWIRIYTKNRDLIKDPDLIFPGQDFKIFKDVLDNEHMVVRGEYLSKIAGYSQVYDDPFKWTQLYELNKSVIDATSNDKDLIYPHMIFIIR